jgi:hypothetical protein
MMKHDDISPDPQRFAGGKVGAAVTILLIASALVVAPAATASAAVIDCSYSPGWGAWIDAGGAPGVKCGGGTGGAGAGTGSSSGTSSKVGQQPASGYGCGGGGPLIPDDFYNHGPILSYFSKRTLPGPLEIQTRDFYRAGKYVGQSRVVLENGVAAEDVYFTDFTLASSGVTIRYHQDCASSGGTTTWAPVYVTSKDSPANFTTAGTLTAPGTPAPDSTSADILTQAALGPVPGSPNKYFLRVDVTNDRTFASDVDIDLDLSEFGMEAVVNLPDDASCPMATAVGERCTFPAVAPGSTETMTFMVRANATSATSAELPIRTFYPGYLMIDSRPTPWELSDLGVVTTDKIPTL